MLFSNTTGLVHSISVSIDCFLFLKGNSTQKCLFDNYIGILIGPKMQKFPKVFFRFSNSTFFKSTDFISSINMTIENFWLVAGLQHWNLRFCSLHRNSQGQNDKFSFIFNWSSNSLAFEFVSSTKSSTDSFIRSEGKSMSNFLSYPMNRIFDDQNFQELPFWKI